MELYVVSSVFERVGNHVDGVVRCINDGRCCNSVDGIDVATQSGSRTVDGTYVGSRVRKGGMPERPQIRRVERNNAIVLSGDVDDIVEPATNLDVRDIQRLSIHSPVDRIGKDLPKSRGVHILRRENGLI